MNPADTPVPAVWPPPPNGPEMPLPESEPQQTPLSIGGVLWYCLANVGYGAFYAFNNFVIPLWLNAYTGNAVLLGLMAGSHSFEGVFIQPVVGSISDRLNGPGGRRRPFMRLFIALAALFLLLTPVAAALPPAVRLAGVIGSIFLFTFTFNIAMDPYQALLADITTPEQRSKVTGFWYFVGAAGQVALLVALALLILPLPPVQQNARIALGFPLLGLLMLATTLLTCARVREPRTAAPTAPGRGHFADIGLALRGLKTLRQARVYMAMFFLFGAGIGAVVPFLTLFIKQVTGTGDGPALLLSALLLVMTAVGSLVFGPLGDRIGPHRLLLLSLGLIALASVNGLWISTLPQVAVVLSVAGLGLGAQNASAYPLLTRLVPPKEIGFYVGLQTAAASLAGPAAVALTGLMINHSSYRVIFGVCALGLLLALVVLFFLREENAAGEVEARQAEMAQTEMARLTDMQERA